jgi:ABC-2 type transport system permease protein
MELRLTSRRGENLLAIVGIPAAVLLFFGSVDVGDGGGGWISLDTLVPGTLALALIATGFVNVGIATAYERQYGVLKRLGGSPLGRGGLVAGKLLAVAAIESILVVALLALAWAVLGWRPGDGASVLVFAAVFVLGTATWTSLGLALAGTLRAEATLALANALFVASLLLGGAIVPVDQLPEPLGALTVVLPAASLTEAFAAALGHGGELGASLLVLGAWGLAGLIVAACTFRWD